MAYLPFFTCAFPIKKNLYGQIWYLSFKASDSKYNEGYDDGNLVILKPFSYTSFTIQHKRPKNHLNICFF